MVINLPTTIVDTCAEEEKLNDDDERVEVFSASSSVVRATLDVVVFVVIAREKLLVMYLSKNRSSL